MTLENYVHDVISDLYNDPEGMLFYSQLMGLVTYDCCDKPFGKSLDERVNDTFGLIDFLTETGDFVPYQYWSDAPDKWGYKPLENGTQELRMLVNDALKRGGERDQSLLSNYLLKKFREGTEPRKPDLRVIKLFKSKS